MKQILLFLMVVFPAVLMGQHDTLWVKNGNVLYGEIKGLSSGVLTMETPYSDDDFTIDYDEVDMLSIERQCIILATAGLRIVGYLKSEKPGQVKITKNGEEPAVYSLKYITGIQQIRNNFFSRFKGNVDLGFNVTKANNQRQLNVGGGLHYKGFKWISDLDISSLVSNRDDVEETQRTNINLGTTRLLSKKWFIRGTGSFLSNTEQNLKGRYSLRVGAGQYLATTSKLMFAVLGGLNYNDENYQDPTLDKQSTELYLGSSLDMFNYKDFSLKTRVELYPSLSERGRLRVDYTLNAKYDLPYDFYVKAEFQFNYDNQVAEGGTSFDYILNTGFGWKFN